VIDPRSEHFIQGEISDHSGICTDLLQHGQKCLSMHEFASTCTRIGQNAFNMLNMHCLNKHRMCAVHFSISSHRFAHRLLHTGFVTVTKPDKACVQIDEKRQTLTLDGPLH
jgi:hypothetical protein